MRAYRGATALQDWETALPADLVAANVREVGVAYNDDPFLAGVTFSGKVTDPARSILLTTGVTDRQRGIPNNPYGTTNGVVLDNGANAAPAISIQVDHVTVERFEITAGGAGGHGIELAGLNPANLGAVRHNLIHDTGGDGIRLSSANSTVDIYNNFIFNTNVGIRLGVDLNSAARVNIFSNTVYNSTTAGIASLDAGGTYVRQTSMRVSLRNNIAHTNPVDFQIAKPFDEAYFCTGLGAGPAFDPSGCTTNKATQLADAADNYQLPFTGANTCLYLGSTSRFRGVAVSPANGGAGDARLTWSYWNNTAWTDLTGARRAPDVELLEERDRLDGPDGCVRGDQLPVGRVRLFAGRPGHLDPEGRERGEQPVLHAGLRLLRLDHRQRRNSFR
jgi:hypothetical protein